MISSTRNDCRPDMQCAAYAPYVPVGLEAHAAVYKFYLGERDAAIPIRGHGLQAYEATQLAFFLYTDIKQVRAAAKILQQLYNAFSENGGSLAEINPLVTTPDGEVVALDAKMVIDDNELDRHPELQRDVRGGKINRCHL